VLVAQRLGAKRKGEELAYLLTLPEADHPWDSLEEVNKQLVGLGHRAERLIKQATTHSHNAAKLNGARVLEEMGKTEAAEQLRARVRSTSSTPAAASDRPWTPQWPQPYYYRPVLRSTHSPVGIASLVLSVAAKSVSISFSFAGFWYQMASVTSHRALPSVTWLPATAIVAVIAVAGLVLGIIGLTQKDRNRAFPILGTVLSAVTILGLLSVLPLAAISASN
jgi:hypothetical protein